MKKAILVLGFLVLCINLQGCDTESIASNVHNTCSFLTNLDKNSEPYKIDSYDIVKPNNQKAKNTTKDELEKDINNLK